MGAVPSLREGMAFSQFVSGEDEQMILYGGCNSVRHECYGKLYAIELLASELSVREVRVQGDCTRFRKRKP